MLILWIITWDVVMDVSYATTAYDLPLNLWHGETRGEETHLYCCIYPRLWYVEMSLWYEMQMQWDEVHLHSCILRICDEFWWVIMKSRRSWRQSPLSSSSNERWNPKFPCSRCWSVSLFSSTTLWRIVPLALPVAYDGISLRPRWRVRNSSFWSTSLSISENL